jgi:hypothetical protein
LLILAAFVTACKPECPDCPEPQDVFPKVIPFTEYSLEGTDCEWTNLPYDEKVMIINNSKEFENYISCTEDNFLAIDFLNHTLLLASGTTNQGIDTISKNLLQLSRNVYKLNIEIQLDETWAVEQWNIALIVKKLSEESTVKLNVNTLN